MVFKAEKRFIGDDFQGREAVQQCFEPRKNKSEEPRWVQGWPWIEARLAVQQEYSDNFLGKSCTRVMHDRASDSACVARAPMR